MTGIDQPPNASARVASAPDTSVGDASARVANGGRLSRLGGALIDAAGAALGRARGRLFAFVPVALAIGIGLWFSLRFEPGAPAYAGVAAGAVTCGILAWRGLDTWRPPAFALMLIGAGFCLAGLRAHHLAAPVLGFRYYGAIEGRVIGIDRSLSDQIRLTLDRVVLERTEPDRVPGRVRVSMHGDQGLDPVPGMVVMMTGHLAPPEGPVEPGGFDFRRHAWFSGIGAVGYTRSPVVVLEPAAAGTALAVTRLRLRISKAVQARIPGDPGAFAAAILTGDRSGISRKTLDDLRAANLSHLLAISGLHMGLLTGFVFAALRYGLALIPPLALRLPVHKIAAVVALAAAGFYLALSGGNVATQRAFTMVAVMLVAVLVDRRAISLRSVAIAATILLVFRPESLTEAGFQMSFAATVALVTAFNALTRLPRNRRGPRWAQPILTVIFTSAVAGAATAPIAAAHFNRIADYGLIANLASVPLMGAVVMPAAVIAGLVSPLGLATPALWMMEQGTRWILFVAGWVAALDGAVTPVPAPPGAVLPILALGALWLVIWPGRARLAGAVMMLAALGLWASADRPTLLVASSGKMVGLMTDHGRALSKPRGDGFATRSWLENDGDPALPAIAATRPGLGAVTGALGFRLGTTRAVHLFGKGAEAALPAACQPGTLVIYDKAAKTPPGRCLLIDADYLRKSGALAIDPGPNGPRVRRAQDTAGTRLWSR
ncbi:competence protein ComEC [Rhodobacteraceae bacterium MBR-64]